MWYTNHRTWMFNKSTEGMMSSWQCHKSQWICKYVTKFDLEMEYSVLLFSWPSQAVDWIISTKNIHSWDSQTFSAMTVPKMSLNGSHPCRRRSGWLSDNLMRPHTRVTCQTSTQRLIIIQVVISWEFSSHETNSEPVKQFSQNTQAILKSCSICLPTFVLLSREDSKWLMPLILIIFASEPCPVPSTTKVRGSGFYHDCLQDQPNNSTAGSSPIVIDYRDNACCNRPSLHHCRSVSSYVPVIFNFDWLLPTGKFPVHSCQRGKRLKVAELAATWNQWKRERRGTELEDRIFQNETQEKRWHKRSDSNYCNTGYLSGTDLLKTFSWIPFDVNDQNNDCKTESVFHLTALHA
jgi:hypothetical protein